MAYYARNDVRKAMLEFGKNREVIARYGEGFGKRPDVIEYEADILGLLIDDYENIHYPIEAPDPIEAIKIRMKELNLKQVDLISEIGGKSRVSEVLNRKRKLTIDMIRNLTEKLSLSAELLIKDYQLMR